MKARIVPFEKSFASHPKSEFWSDKNELKPHEVYLNSGYCYIFDCRECGHEITKVLSSVTRGEWCGYCSGRFLCSDDNCTFCFNKSFASHEKAKCWSDKNELKPRQVFLNSAKSKIIFNCEKCNHELNITCNNVYNGYWCCYCASQKLCENNNCSFCFNKSFASHSMSDSLSHKNPVKPRQIFLNTNSKYIFKCKKCDHEFSKSPHKINVGINCPYCCYPPQKLCEDENCKECSKKTFATHPMSIYWSDKNELKPNQVFLNTEKKYIFNCHECKDDFEITCLSVNTGSRCSCVKNKTEKKLFKIMKKKYPNLKTQFRVAWCKNITYLPFDFVINDLKIIVENDGKQHIRQVWNWKDPKEQQERDKYKMKCANENGYSVIRILQEDVFYDKYNWFDELNQSIQKIIKDGIVQNIYLCKNNEYSVYFD